MNPFALLPLAACVMCLAYCVATTPATYDSSQRRSRWLGKLLFACAATWAFCEVGFALAPDAASAETFIPLSIVAMLCVGPIAVDIAQALKPPRRTHATIGVSALYGIAALLVAVQWTTSLCFTGVVTVPWGFALESGPLHPVYFAFVAGCSIACAWTCRTVIARTRALGPDLGGRRIAGMILVLLAIGSMTDAILPMLGIQTPRLTTTGFGLLAGWLLWSMSRPQGYVFATPAIISREILRSIHEGVVFLTLDDRVLLANEGMETFLGAPADQIIGRPFQHHVPALPLDEPQERIDVECQLHPLAGGPITIAASVSTARDHRGSPLGLVVVVRDLRQIELLRTQLVMSGRLAAVGQLAAGIAHEINNPLAFVRTNLGVLREHWSEVTGAFGNGPPHEPIEDVLKEGEEIIAESIDGVDRAARIVRDVREFSHAGRPEREHVDVNELIDRVLRISTAELGRRTRVERAYGEVPRIPASPQQLEQVFLNLIVNAVQAIGGDGCVSIRTTHERDRVVIRVSDDGDGIADDVADRIFDPFFTTKAVGEGTGLGLSISHQIVQNHEGEIAAEQGPSRGACFRVSLPVEASAPSES